MVKYKSFKIHKEWEGEEFKWMNYRSLSSYERWLEKVSRENQQRKQKKNNLWQPPQQEKSIE